MLRRSDLSQHGRTSRSITSGPDSTGTKGLDPVLETRYRKLKGKLQESPQESTEIPPQVACFQTEESRRSINADTNKGKKTNLSVSWADHVGAPLLSLDQGGSGSSPLPIGSSRIPLSRGGDGAATAANLRSKGPNALPCGSGSVAGKTYKEVLLAPHSSKPNPPRPFLHQREKREPTSARHRRVSFSQLQREGRCYRCFARDHLSRECRDPHQVSVVRQERAPNPLL